MKGDSIINGGYADDAYLDGEYIEEIVISDEDGSGYFQLGDTTVIELHSIGLETADFLRDIESEVFRGGVFDAPPANVRTNITEERLAISSCPIRRLWSL